jgi:PUA domain protein
MRAAHVKRNHAVVLSKQIATRTHNHLPAVASECSKSMLQRCPSAIANVDLEVRFQPSADIAGQTTVKSSIQRGIRSAILSSWKIDVETLEEIWPKKESIVHVKWSVALVVFHDFASHRTPNTAAEIISQSTHCTASPSFSSTLTGLIFPLCVFSTNASNNNYYYIAVKLTELGPLDPFILPHVRVDRGAIRFLLAGAHMMCPGLTSAGGWLPPADAALPAGTPVAFDAEGKEFAVGIGIMKLGTEEMKVVKKGVAVESITYVGDDLWAIQKL